jgi:hypothetical protein
MYMNNKIIEELKRQTRLELENSSIRNNAILNNPNIQRTNKFLDKNVIQSENYLLQARNFVLNEIREISDQTIALFILEKLSESQIKTLYNYFNDFKINLTKLKLPIDKSGFLQFLFTWLKKYNLSKYDEIKINEVFDEDEDDEVEDDEVEDDEVEDENIEFDDDEVEKELVNESEIQPEYIENNNIDENDNINEKIKELNEQYKILSSDIKDINADPKEEYINQWINDYINYTDEYLFFYDDDDNMRSKLIDNNKKLINKFNPNLQDKIIRKIQEVPDDEPNDNNNVEKITYEKADENDNITEKIKELNEQYKILSSDIKDINADPKEEYINQWINDYINYTDEYLFFYDDDDNMRSKLMDNNKKLINKFNPNLQDKIIRKIQKISNDETNNDDDDDDDDDDNDEKITDEIASEMVNEIINEINDELNEELKNNRKMTNEDIEKFKRESLEKYKTWKPIESSIKKPVEQEEDEEEEEQEEQEDKGAILKNQYKELFNMADVINLDGGDEELEDGFVKEFYDYIDNFSQFHQNKNKVNNEKAKLKKRFTNENVKQIMLGKINDYKKAIKPVKEKKPRKKTKAEIEQERINQALTNEPIKKAKKVKKTKGKGLEPIRIRIGAGLREFNEKIPKFYIDMKKFNNHNTLSLKYTSNHNSHPKLRPKLMSKAFKNVMIKIFDEQETKEDILKLSKDEQIYLSKLSKIIDIKNYINDDLEDEFNESYETMSGIIRAGNDNPEIIRKMKYLIFSAVEQGIISQKEAYKYLAEISLL